MDLNLQLRSLLTDMGADLVGFADVSGLAPDGYQKAVVAAIALPPEIIHEIPVGPTPEYIQVYKDYNRRLEDMSRAAAALLCQQGHRSLALCGENAPWSRETMASPFPYKTSATRAGLGWVGKCALLVTPEFGSAIRLTVALTDAPLVVSAPMETSRCGDCTACMEACPGHAVKGALWEAGLSREALVDIPACDRTARGLAEQTLGYPTTICGRCFAACPYTKAYLARVENAR